MADYRRPVRTLAVILAATCVLSVAGCSAPTATLDLLTVARQGLADARDAQQTMHEQYVQHLQARQRALDAAFDADVKLAAAGQLKNIEGQPVDLSPEWIISARKGYAAARDILADQTRLAEANHAVRIDNLHAAEDAIDMTEQLIMLQWSIAEPLRQQFLNLRKRLFHEPDASQSNAAD